MLKYEERFHFDQRYQRLLKNFKQNWAGRLVCHSAIYTLLYYLLRYGTMTILTGDVCWAGSSVIKIVGNIPISIADLFFFFTGIVLYCTETIRLSRIMSENHSVRNGNVPDRLLTEGVYLKSRHPMYASFLMIEASIVLALHTIGGLVLILLFILLQYLNAFREENRLKTMFQKQYVIYCSKTKVRILSKLQLVILLLMGVITLAGFRQ